MFFPLYTDQRLRTTPWVTYGIVLLNVAVYTLTWRDIARFSAGGVGLSQALEQLPVGGYYLWPGDAVGWVAASPPRNSPAPGWAASRSRASAPA